MERDGGREQIVSNLGRLTEHFDRGIGRAHRAPHGDSIRPNDTSIHRSRDLDMCPELLDEPQPVTVTAIATPVATPNTATLTNRFRAAIAA